MGADGACTVGWWAGAHVAGRDVEGAAWFRDCGDIARRGDVGARLPALPPCRSRDSPRTVAADGVGTGTAGGECGGFCTSGRDSRASEGYGMTWLVIDFDSTFVKVEALDELARIALSDAPDAAKRVSEIEAI